MSASCTCHKPGARDVARQVTTVTAETEGQQSDLPPAILLVELHLLLLLLHCMRVEVPECWLFATLYVCAFY